MISEVVLKEVRAGDPGAAQHRMAFNVELPLLDITDEATELAATLVEQVPLPPQAAVDAAHIAVAAYHGVDLSSDVERSPHRQRRAATPRGGCVQWARLPGPDCVYAG